MWGMTRLYMWHDSFICVTCFINVCDMINRLDMCDMTAGLFMCDMIHRCDLIHRYVWSRLEIVEIDSSVWHDSSICVMWIVIYIYIYICMYIFVYVCIHTHIYTHMVCVCVRVRVRACHDLPLDPTDSQDIFWGIFIRVVATRKLSQSLLKPF